MTETARQQAPLTLKARDGPTVTQHYPPYPPWGILTLDREELRWTHSPWTWTNFSRWGERPRNPPPITIAWAEVQAIRLAWVSLRFHKTLEVRNADGPYHEQRWHIFGDIDEHHYIACFERLGCTVDVNPTDPSSRRISVPTGG